MFAGKKGKKEREKLILLGGGNLASRNTTCSWGEKAPKVTWKREGRER